jgi:membrane protein
MSEQPATSVRPGPADTGHVPAGPHRLSIREWVDALKRAFKEFMADDAMGLSQQIAYSSLLAFFPAVIFLVALLDLVDAYETLEEFLSPVAPAAVIDTIEDIEENATTGGSAVAFVAGAAGAVWAASGAMNSIMKAVNRAYDREETRPFWKTRLLAIFLVVLTGVVTAVIFLLIVFGGPLGEAIADKARLGTAFDVLWGIFRWPLAFSAILIFFSIVYYLAPDLDVRDWKWISPGALVGGMLWLALSALFAVYTSFAGSYNETYGSIAGGIVLLLWLNYSAFALLFGAELNAELDRQADIHAAGGPNAGLISPARRAR